MAVPIAKDVIKENKGSNFFVELKMIRTMSTRLSSRKIENRWSSLLDGVRWSAEEVQENEIYVQRNRHKFSHVYSDLYDY